MFKGRSFFSVLLIFSPTFFLAAGSFAAESIAVESKTVALSGESKSAQQKVATTATANSEITPSDPTVNLVPHLGVNWDVFLGYAFSNWSSFTSEGHGAWANIGGIQPENHTKGGFNVGGDLGYQIIRYFGMEFGYYHFRQVDGDSLSVDTPYFYAAGKVSYPFLANDDLSVFAKVGAALRMVEYGGDATQGVYNNKRYDMNFLYGLGVQYYFAHRWKASMQWLEIPAKTGGTVNSKQSSKQVPRTDQLLLGLGYLFSI